MVDGQQIPIGGTSAVAPLWAWIDRRVESKTGRKDPCSGLGGFGQLGDRQAADSAKSIDALAYTFGKDIVFGEGQYTPHSNAGERLLAHELAHVIQQRSRPSLIQRDANSDDKQGYQDGLNGGDSQPGPRDGDALTDYNEGYAKGHYEFSQQTGYAADRLAGLDETGNREAEPKYTAETDKRILAALDQPVPAGYARRTALGDGLDGLAQARWTVTAKLNFAIQSIIGLGKMPQADKEYFISVRLA